MKKAVWNNSWSIVTAATATPRFSSEQKEEMKERLRQGPGEAARKEAAPTEDGPTPGRWTLRTIRATFDFLSDYTLGGVSRFLDRQLDVRLRSARVQQYSPDPDYLLKREYLLMCLRKVRKDPHRFVVVFLDEAGFERWPEPARDWMPQSPEPARTADRQDSKQGLWRLIGAMNARSGRVSFLDAYVVGRKKVLEMYDLLNRQYRRAERIYVIQDNWSIHQHEDVLEGLEQWPRIEPVWLPTYSPWLNPIEKLWRWLKQDVLKLHRKADSWSELKDQVRSFLHQFQGGSKQLLRYVGLKGKGRLAKALNGY